MGRVLTIDGGRSGCRVAVIGPGGREGGATGPGLPTLTGPAGLPGVLRAVGETVALCPAGSGPFDVVAAGLAGLLGSLDHAPALAGGLARLLGAGRVLLTGDIVTAYAGALGLQPGVVVAAGTGAVALAVTSGDTPGPPGTSGDTPGPPGTSGDTPGPPGTSGDTPGPPGGAGSATRADGWGHLLGDAGSGFWVGRRGLEAALRAYDGRGGSAVLAVLAEDHLGPLGELPARLEASAHPTAMVAGFTRQVAEAARRGDRLARSIWAEAAAELAASAAACARRLFPAGTKVPVSWSGGLFAAGDPEDHLLLDPFLDRLSEVLPGCVPTPPAGDALAGAAWLAGPDGPGLLGRFVHDSAGSTPARPVAVAAVLT